MNRGNLIVSVSAGVLILSVGGASYQDRLPDGVGKPETAKVCSGCHDAEVVLAHLETPAEWAETLQNMAQLGAEATTDEWRLIERYLDANLALIMINKAGADEVQLTIDITRDLADAVVKYRQDKGPFKSIDDVKKVPGLDAAKIEARKSRFIF